MLKKAPRYIKLQPEQKFDLPGHATFEQRSAILHRLLEHNPKFVVKGGNSKTNPYKRHYDIILAEKREVYESLQNSYLWSPRYTPKTFKNFFLFPLFGVVFLIWYLRYIALPRKMLRLRREQGFKFEGLEQNGWLDNWIDDEIQDEIYQDHVLKDLEDISRLTNDSKAEATQRMSEIQKQKKKEQMSNKLEEIYQLRKQKGLEEPKSL